MKKSKGLYRYRGFTADLVAGDLYYKLFPNSERNIGSRTRAIFRAFDKVYTDGVEDALELSDAQLARERRKVAGEE